MTRLASGRRSGSDVLGLDSQGARRPPGAGRLCRRGAHLLLTGPLRWPGPLAGGRPLDHAAVGRAARGSSPQSAHRGHDPPELPLEADPRAGAAPAGAPAVEPLRDGRPALPRDRPDRRALSFRPAVRAARAAARLRLVLRAPPVHRGEPYLPAPAPPRDRSSCRERWRAGIRVLVLPDRQLHLADGAGRGGLAAPGALEPGRPGPGGDEAT